MPFFRSRRLRRVAAATFAVLCIAVLSSSAVAGEPQLSQQPVQIDNLPENIFQPQVPGGPRVVFLNTPFKVSIFGPLGTNGQLCISIPGAPGPTVIQVHVGASGVWCYNGKFSRPGLWTFVWKPAGGGGGLVIGRFRVVGTGQQ